MLLASANMLNHVNLQYYGDMIQNAVDRVIRVGKVSVDKINGLLCSPSVVVQLLFFLPHEHCSIFKIHLPLLESYINLFKVQK